VNNKDIFLFLEENYERYNRSDFIESDPICIPRQFSKKQDIEIAGFLTATIAWGQRPTIITNANKLMGFMDNSPYDFILNHSKKDLLQFKNFKHRTFNGIDCMFFIKSLQNIYEKQGGLESVFFSPLSAQQAEPSQKRVKNNTSVAKEAISNFRKIFFSMQHPHRTEKHISKPPPTLISDGNGSACKRINMFLRWMVRKDKREVDFGIWNPIYMKELMIPLDIHSGNVSRKLGLLYRKQNDWQSVEELTSRLRTFDAKDPVKYDFALFGLGVSGFF
jgi:uncharacterized protein (TIGR02757 family)